MTDRGPLMSKVRRVVVKVGTSIITDENRHLSEARIRNLAQDLLALPPTVRDVIIVSSGAIAAGRSKHPLARPFNIPQKQAMAALGQSRLMWAYEKVFSECDRKVAQVLVTLAEFRDRHRFINARNTILTLLSWGVVPVVNENDTVAVEEIKFGDNDTLSALVTSLSEADLLIILSDVDGLFDRDPRLGQGAALVPEVTAIDTRTRAMAGDTTTSTGTGGMATKLKAAEKVMGLGVPVVIANGHNPGTIGRILAGEPVGTLFLPGSEKLASRKHWIRHTLRPKGSIVVDAGGVRAILEQGRSLLPVGILKTEGTFQPGDAVRCLDEQGREFARGLVNYGTREVDLIRGRRTDEIGDVLGYKYYDEVIHRDDLVVIG